MLKAILCRIRLSLMLDTDSEVISAIQGSDYKQPLDHDAQP